MGGPKPPQLWALTTHLPAFDVRLQLLQGLQLLHLPLGLIDVGADSLHGLQGTLYCGVVRVLAGGPLGQLLAWEGAEKRAISPGAYAPAEAESHQSSVPRVEEQSPRLLAHSFI